MSDAGFLTRVVIRNYKSIAACGVPLQPFTVLIGPSGAGKSNFLDAIRFVSDALGASLEHAFRERGGIGEVRRRSAGHPTHFGVRLEFTLPGGVSGSYAFRIGAKPNGAFDVQNEECVLRPPEALAHEARFSVAAGAGPSDRLNLPAAPAFRPACDALCRMEFYNPNPDRIKDLQLPDSAGLLARDARNITAVIDAIARRRPDLKAALERHLGTIAPGICGVEAVAIGPRETLQFQESAAGESPWRFYAANMSDGILRALAALVAAFQPGNSTLAGIEEPETSLHPAAAAILLDALIEAAASRQILVTSHSADVLDHSKLTSDAILAVVSEASATYCVPLDAMGRETLRKRLCTSGDFERLRPDRDGLAEVTSQQLELIDEDPGQPT